MGSESIAHDSERNKKISRQNKTRFSRHCFGFSKPALFATSGLYKITKVVRALWLAERSVCMRVCKHGCAVKMFCFSCANHASTNCPNLKKFFSSKLDKFTLFTHSFVGWNLENLDKQAMSILFSLKLTSEVRKIRNLESIFLQNKNWLRVYKTLRLVRISILISALSMSFAFFSTVMQALDFVSALHNCLKFSQPLSWLYQAMQTRKTFSIA